MARFDVYELRSSGTMVVNYQSDLLDHYATRFIIPLLPPTNSRRPTPRLNPVFKVQDKDLVFYPQLAATVRASELATPIDSLAEHHTEIIDAIDMLISGF
ncbi:CcdB family protein [Alterisphingorhabdus coralli]|uniref:Toxin CcdB n=1 Tax=Alterisphingorhabdus coralli TaxID=3071408 RepID=A0AA97HZW1_9SPHN|nr:CcdB family protein [Parasphingorhabdus sp. SCSIO 66989]WOE74252.1 CcdB family protein [Parasphingorhabdus sp. SCSIO 66989]